MKCNDEKKHLRNEINSKSTTIKILSDNLSFWRMLHINISKMKLLLLRIIIKTPLTINVQNIRNGNAKDISDNKIVPQNRFESLCSSKDERDDFLSDKHVFDKNYAIVPTNIKRQISEIEKFKY